MKSNLKKFALFAEIIGSIAIIVSLLFVGIEMRRNTNATYAASYDQLRSDEMQWRMALAGDPTLLEEINKSVQAGYPGVEQNYTRSGVYWEALVQTWERAYFAHYRGTLADEEWSRYERTMCLGAEVIKGQNIPERNFSTSFIEYLNNLDCSARRVNRN